MFDITSTKLLLLGIVALIVIGPKDLPVLLRTVGKYAGMIRRQAAEFRAQFEEAMRESELDQLKKDVEQMGTEAETSMREAERSVTTEIDAARADVEKATDTALVEQQPEARERGSELAMADSQQTNGADRPGETDRQADAEAARVEHKSGA
jgi:sec-independent protein translocase protein TatB